MAELAVFTAALTLLAYRVRHRRRPAPAVVIQRPANVVNLDRVRAERALAKQLRGGWSA